jgi:hypothetical protein
MYTAYIMLSILFQALLGVIPLEPTPIGYKQRIKRILSLPFCLILAITTTMTCIILLIVHGIEGEDRFLNVH